MCGESSSYEQLVFEPDRQRSAKTLETARREREVRLKKRSNLRSWS
jgi:hypothetical protein